MSKKNSNNGLYSFYVARESKSGERINISLIREDEDGEKEYATISLPKDKVKVTKGKDGKTYAVVGVKFAEEFEKPKAKKTSSKKAKAEDDEEDDEKDDDCLPF